MCSSDLNGFLAAGLLWSIIGERRDVATFFLACVVVAGLYGAATVNKRIFIVQSVPALIALAGARSGPPGWA